MIYPLASVGEPPQDDMPEDMRELYVEAASVAVVSRRAGAALARTTVEKLLKQLDSDASTKAKLDARIERVRPRVSASLGEMLDIVRVAGNGAVHVDDNPDDIVALALSDEEGPQLLELFLATANQLVDELITRPRTTRGLWRQLPEGVRRKLRPDDPDAETPHGSDSGATS